MRTIPPAAARQRQRRVREHRLRPHVAGRAAADRQPQRPVAAHHALQRAPDAQARHRLRPCGRSRRGEVQAAAGEVAVVRPGHARPAVGERQRRLGDDVAQRRAEQLDVHVAAGQRQGRGAHPAPAEAARHRVVRPADRRLAAGQRDAEAAAEDHVLGELHVERVARARAGLVPRHRPGARAGEHHRRAERPGGRPGGHRDAAVLQALPGHGGRAVGAQGRRDVGAVEVGGRAEVDRRPEAGGARRTLGHAHPPAGGERQQRPAVRRHGEPRRVRVDGPDPLRRAERPVRRRDRHVERELRAVGVRPGGHELAAGARTRAAPPARARPWPWSAASPGRRTHRRERDGRRAAGTDRRRRRRS